MKLMPRLALALAALAIAAPRAQEPAAAVEPLHFHHIHLNSTDPKAAAAYYPKPFALSATATTFNGFEAVKTGNVYILFTKVAATPQNELTGPQTSVWHFGWNTPDSRKYDENFRKMGLTIAQMWDAADGKLVDLSSDTLPGLPTQEQILEMRAKGTQPTRQGGFGYLRGPDGAMIENAQAGTTERFNHVHMYHEEPFCAQLWYQKHLNVAPPQGRRGAPPAEARTEANCKVPRGADKTFPALDVDGLHRAPQIPLTFGDVSMGGYTRQVDASLVGTRGHLADHVGLSVSDLDAWVAKLRAEHVTFLEQPYKLGDTRAVMIEGPSREALELVEVKP